MEVRPISIKALIPVLLFVSFFALCCVAAEVECGGGEGCSLCTGGSPRYVSAILTGIQFCPIEFHEDVIEAYSNLDDVMYVVLIQDDEYPCEYNYIGPVFQVDGAPYDFRLRFFLNFYGNYGATDFWIIVQQETGGWYDAIWCGVSVPGYCSRNGCGAFGSLCNAPSPDIESGEVCWMQTMDTDGNCPDYGPDEIPEDCNELSCETLNEYTFFGGPEASYSGPREIYSPSECEGGAKKGNTVRTARISCPGAKLVVAQAQSSSPEDITVSPQQVSCQEGDTAVFTISALRGRGQVTLNTDFYSEVYSQECIALKSTKTVVIQIEPDNGDECCQDEYKPVLLGGSPGNVSTLVRAGAKSLEEWPRANIYVNGDDRDIEVVVPGRFNPIIFNESKPPAYMQGWKAVINSNIVTVTNPEGFKYIYGLGGDYKISLVQNPQGMNIVEFVYDANGLPMYQNDLVDTSLYISYHYDTNGRLSEIREHSGADYREFGIEYDSTGRVSYVNSWCSECEQGDNRRYSYNADGTMKYEKTIAGEIVYEYVFDQQGRLLEKWLGAKQETNPVQIISYRSSTEGYIADVKDYIDSENWRSSREYRSNGGVVTKKTAYQQLDETPDNPQGADFTEYFIYDYKQIDWTVLKLTEIKPAADYNEQAQQGCVRTEYIYDANSGEVIGKTNYDSNDNPTVVFENFYEYLDVNGVPTSEPKEIYFSRVVESFDVYGANTVYLYDDGSRYPAAVLLPAVQDNLSSGQLRHDFLYDSEKKVVGHQFVENKSGLIKLSVENSYDGFGNLLTEQYTDNNDVDDITEYQYNKFNEVIRIKTAGGVVFGKEYDNSGRVVSEFTIADVNDINLSEPDLISQKRYIYDLNGLLSIEAEGVDEGEFVFGNPEKWVYTQYEYDRAGRIIKITEGVNGAELQTLFEYNNQDELAKVTYPDGKWIEYFRDGRGLVTSEITGFDIADILMAEYQYDKNGNCIRQIEPDGIEAEFEYDEFDRLVVQKQLSSADANVSIDTVYEYDQAGNINREAVVDVNGAIISEKTYGYDNLGRCKIVRQRKQPGTDDNANDFITLYVFDCLDRVTKKVLKAPGSTNMNSIDENNDVIISLEYDGLGRVGKVSNAENNSTRISYAPDGEVSSVTNGLNFTTTNTIDKYGRIAETETPLGNYKKTIFDSLDRAVRETIYDHNDIAVSQRRLEYDNLGNLLKTITMLNPTEQGDSNVSIDNIIQFDYNDITGFIDSRTYWYNTTEQATESIEYDPIGRFSKIVDAVGNSVVICYDANVPGRIGAQQITYADVCEPVTVTTWLQYDDFGRIGAVRLFNNNSSDFNDLVTEFEYDGLGNVVKQIKPGGLEIIYQYDSLCNLTKITEDAEDINRVTEFEYDRLGRNTAITAFDVNDQKTQFLYDKNGQVIKIIYPDNSEEIYQYDALGRITERISKNNQKIYYTYDAEDNLIQQSDDINNPQFLIEFEYDPTGMITYAEKVVTGQTISENEFTYNGLGKVVEENSILFGTWPKSIEYNYDQAGNIVRQKFDSTTYSYQHDGLGRIKAVKQNDNLIAEIEYFASAVKKQNFPAVGFEYVAEFDEIARINRCTAIEANSSNLLDFVYTYNNASERILAGKDYQYDKFGRIIKAEYAQEETEEFSYSPFGSRDTVETKESFTETYYKNKLNQYTKIHTDFHFYGFTFDANLYWDENGNLSEEELYGLAYQYDILNNLIKVTYDTQTVAEFAYDALGRRIRKISDEQGVIYHYDLNNRIIAEYSINEANFPTLSAHYLYGSDLTDVIVRLLPEEPPFDYNGLIKLWEFCQTYLYETGQSQYNPEYDYDSSGIVNLQDFAEFASQNRVSLPHTDTGERQWYYFKDALGSTGAVVSDRHNISQYDYDCFGRVGGTDIQSGFLFAGYYYDAEIEKYYCQNRYYDADIGSFLSCDPLGFADSLNLYEYVGNRPVMLTDDLGLKSSLVDELKFLVGAGKIRADSERMSQTLKEKCQQLQLECTEQPCIGKIHNPQCQSAGRCMEFYRKAIEFDEKLNSECAKAAALGSLEGAAQGLLNTVNGIQDSAVGTLNLGLGVWNYSGALIYDKKLDYITSPDWSRDLIVKESTGQHNASKFLGSEGALTLATLGLNHWRDAHLINKIHSADRSAASATKGIYEFTSSSGKTYIGQSSNIPARIRRHIQSGKLLREDLRTLRTMHISGGKVAREIAEQARIDRLGGVRNLENIRNAIGPARKYLLLR